MKTKFFTKVASLLGTALSAVGLRKKPQVEHAASSYQILSRWVPEWGASISKTTDGGCPPALFYGSRAYHQIRLKNRTRRWRKAACAR
jgi:hypothetical protein